MYRCNTHFLSAQIATSVFSMHPVPTICSPSPTKRPASVSSPKPGKGLAFNMPQLLGTALHSLPLSFSSFSPFLSLSLSLFLPPFPSPFLPHSLTQMVSSLMATRAVGMRALALRRRQRESFMRQNWLAMHPKEDPTGSVQPKICAVFLDKSSFRRGRSKDRFLLHLKMADHFVCSGKVKDEGTSELL